MVGFYARVNYSKIEAYAREKRNSFICFTDAHRVMLSIERRLMSSATKKQNPFKVLGLTPSATEADIRKAHKELTKKYHPDKNPGQNTTEKMKAINAARDELLNFETREQAEQDFNASRSKGSSSTAGTGRQNSNSSNSSTNQNSSKGGRSSQDSRTRSGRPKIEKDVYVKVRITPRRAKHGGYLTIKVNYSYGPGKATIVVPHSTIDESTQSYPGWGQMAEDNKEIGSLIVTFIIDPNAKDSGIYFDDIYRDFRQEHQNVNNENSYRDENQSHTYNQPYTSQEYSRGALKRVAQVVFVGVIIIWGISSLLSSSNSTTNTGSSTQDTASSPVDSGALAEGNTNTSSNSDGNSNNAPADASNSSNGAPADNTGATDATGSVGETTDSPPTPDPLLTNNGDAGASGGIGA